MHKKTNVCLNHISIDFPYIVLRVRMYTRQNQQLCRTLVSCFSCFRSLTKPAAVVEADDSSRQIEVERVRSVCIMHNGFFKF